MAQPPPNANAHAAAGPRRARRVFLAVACALSLLLAGGSGFAIVTIRHVEATITKIPVGRGCTDPDCLSSVEEQCVKEACNYLILGSDSRAGLPSNFGTTKNIAGQRSDTIIVVQVDAKKRRTIVLSIPRDLLVAIPGHGENKINTAFDFGANTMVRTVERLTGLQINHYVEVNFLGFEHLVDALGGIPVCINKPLKDELAQLNLPKKGCYNLKGKQALAFVRARHIEGDAIPDFSRISRQQQFMRALISKVLSAGSLFHLPELINAVKHNLKIDKNLDLYALQDLTKKLGELGQSRVTFRIVPAVPLEIQGVDYLKLLNPQASQLFQRIRDGKSLGTLGQQSALTPLSPANVTVQVLDAGSGGQAQKVVDYLQRAGFAVLPVQAAPAGLTTSVILWRHAQARPKEVVASYLTNLGVEFDSDHTIDSAITVVIGADFPGIEGQ